MTETDIVFDLRAVGNAMRDIGLAARQCARAFDGFIAAADPLWAITPGEWPDNFTLLNRYLRTGVKPRFLFNE